MNNILLDSLKEYYNNEKNMNKLLKIIHQTNTKISLRIIDWFVTNYSKKHNIYYSIYKTPSGVKTFETQKNTLIKHFNTYHSYKSQLKSYSKKLFDPFCRTERIDFVVNGETIKTTIGQLNFVRWCIQNNIIEHALKEVETKKTNAKTGHKIHATDTSEIDGGTGSREVCQPLAISG